MLLVRIELSTSHDDLHAVFHPYLSDVLLLFLQVVTFLALTHPDVEHYKLHDSHELRRLILSASHAGEVLDADVAESDPTYSLRRGVRHGVEVLLGHGPFLREDHRNDLRAGFILRQRIINPPRTHDRWVLYVPFGTAIYCFWCDDSKLGSSCHFLYLLQMQKVVLGNLFLLVVGRLYCRSICIGSPGPSWGRQRSFEFSWT
mmetsp:Transcript_42866/g.135173  ORF Transcript_42866/g.135173 Transcript_42866/m.135173 type:complete len:202 (-) Transcript_42866:647-1252(-)